MGHLTSQSFDLQLAALTFTIAAALVFTTTLVFPRIARRARDREFQLARLRADGEIQSIAERFHVPEATPTETPTLKAFRAQQAFTRHTISLEMLRNCTEIA